MLFNTITYLLFLPIVFGLYWSQKSGKMQNIVILLASMVFYGWWSTNFLVLMIATCVINYSLVMAMDNYKEHRKAYASIAIILNFVILGIFKYFNFFAENLDIALSSIGISADIPTLNIILPVGISFYTFQLSGYVIDNYKGIVKREHNILDFLAFISFFPQLVAGPIERGKDMLPQITKKRCFDYVQARDGMRQLLWGLIKKMLIADNCAEVTNYIFDNYSSCSMPDLWLGALFFTFQIYGDFSGYSDMAIGSAKLFGIQLSTNFSRPYFAKNIQEFWRRWHITLMTWFKDYVYIPLGGNRKGSVRKHLNNTIVFLLSGLWHGSNWTFVVWGLFHSIWFIIPHKWLTFIIVMIGWVIFRSPDLATAYQYTTSMFNPDLFGPTTCSRIPVLLILLLVITEWKMKENIHPFSFKEYGWQNSQIVRMSIYLILFIATIYFGGEKTQFIYFQF